MKIIFHHNVGIPKKRVETVKGNPHCVRKDAGSPNNTYPCTRKETNQKIHRCDFILSVRSDGRMLHLNGWFHSLHYFACCCNTRLAKQAKQHKQDRCKHHYMALFQIYYFHAHSLPWQSILCYGWDLNWTSLQLQVRFITVWMNLLS